MLKQFELSGECRTGSGLVSLSADGHLNVVTTDTMSLRGHQHKSSWLAGHFGFQHGRPNDVNIRDIASVILLLHRGQDRICFSACGLFR